MKMQLSKTNTVFRLIYSVIVLSAMSNVYYISSSCGQESGFVILLLYSVVEYFKGNFFRVIQQDRRIYIYIYRKSIFLG